jgi:hypothetical protein
LRAIANNYIIAAAVDRYQLQLIIYNVQQEVIIQWLPINP